MSFYTVNGLPVKTTTQTITTNTSWTSPTTIEAGNLISVNNGVTLTINTTLDAGPYQIFSGLGSVSFGSAFNGTVYPEWFGAVGDGSTDDASAIQKAVDSLAGTRGTIIFGSKTYKIGTVITISSSNLNLQGQGNWATRILIPNATQSAFQFTGTNSSSKINHNSVTDMFIYKSVTATGGVGILLQYTAFPNLKNLQIADFGYGVQLYNSTNSLIENVICTNSSGTYNFRGFYLDGTDPAGNVSSMLRDCAVDAAGNTGHSYGFYCASSTAGGNLNDVYFDNCATASCYTGYYFDLSNQLTGSWGDIILTNPIVDFYTDYGIYVANSPSNSAMTITGGWIDAKPLATETDGIYLNSANAVTISGTQFWCDTTSARNTYGIKIVSSNDILIKGCVFNSHKYGVYSDASSFCSISSNKFSGASGFATTHIFLDTTTTNCILNGNLLNGYATNGISYGASTSKNTAINTKFSTNITTPISDSGTNDTLVLGGTTSAWGGTNKALEFTGTPFIVGQASNGVIHISGNLYFDGSNYKYKNTGFATDYFQLNGTHVWRNAASGTAGNTITLSTLMTLDANGNLGINNTSPTTKLTLGKSTNSSNPSLLTGTLAHLIQVDSTSPIIQLDSYGTSTQIIGRRVQGTSASPTQLVNTAIMLRLGGQGRDDTGYNSNTPVAIDLLAEGTWTTTSLATGISFKTTTASSTTLTERVRINNSGQMGIGKTPSSILDIASSTANDAIKLQSSATGEGGQLSFFSSDGSIGSEANSSSSKVLGDIYFSGYATSAFRNGALIRAQQNGSFTSNSVPTDLYFYTGDGTNSVTSRMIISATGNIGMGVTPSAWGTGNFGLELGGTPFLIGQNSSGLLHISSNLYFDGANYKYKANGFATDHYQLNGTYVWRTASSGTAGNNITFSTAMTLDASGNLGIGTTPTSTLTVNGSLARNIVTKTADYTVGTTDTHIICNKAGTLTLTLPTASSFTGREITIRTITANTVVSASSNVVPAAGGAAGTAILAATAGKWALLVSDGTNWQIQMSN